MGCDHAATSTAPRAAALIYDLTALLATFPVGGVGHPHTSGPRPQEHA
ncbi:hypothetical protein [Streptomyces sp. Ac-502]